MTAALKPRAALEAAVEALLAVLDLIEPDPDLEDGADGEPDADGEPWLAGFGIGDDDREPDGDEGDYSGGEFDPPGFIPGGQGA